MDSDYSENIVAITTNKLAAMYAKIFDQTGNPFINSLIHQI